jgi:hypothetical protein
MKYLIYAALREDVNSGWVWISEPKFRQRAVIRISNSDTNKTVYCEVLQIDDNFLNYYNDYGGGRISIEKGAHVLVLNQWYRKILGDLSTKSEYEFTITEAENWKGKIKSCFQHPQVIVRVATWLAALSVVEGLLGILFGIISLV